MPFTGKATYTGGPELPEQVEDLGDLVSVVSPHETPLLDHLGDGLREATGTIHEWLEDSLLINRTTIDDAALAGGGLATAFAVARPEAFRVGDLVRAGTSDEIMLVQSVDPGTRRITVMRRYGGSAGTTLANGLTLTVLGNAALEGADADPARFTSRVRRWNATQIFTATVEVSGTMRASALHAVEDELDYQKQMRMRELLRDLENTVINGIAPDSGAIGSPTQRRTMNGILALVRTNVFRPGQGGLPSGGGAGGDELTEPLLNAALRAVWEHSDAPIDTLVMGGGQKRRLNQFIAPHRRFGPDDDVYTDLVGVYESDYGVCRVVLSRWVPPGRVLMLDSSRIGVIPMRGRSFHMKPLAARGDAHTAQVIGEYTLELRNESAHAVLGGLAP